LKEAPKTDAAAGADKWQRRKKAWLKLDLDTAVTTALQSQAAVADIVLAMLQKADTLCEMAEASRADMSAVAGALEQAA
jgi:hypothetical protein